MGIALGWEILRGKKLVQEGSGLGEGILREKKAAGPEGKAELLWKEGMKPRAPPGRKGRA